MKAGPYHGTNANEYFCPLNPEGGGYIVFGADPVGVGVGAGFPPVHYLLNQMMDFDQTCIATFLAGEEELIILKISRAL